MEAKTYAEISKLPREDLIRRYDQIARSHGPIVDIEFFRQEIWRHDSEQFNLRMQRITSQMGWLTWVITILTVVNVGFVIYSVVT